MNRLWHLLCAYLYLLSAVPALAAQSLPVSVPGGVPSDSVLARELMALMRDYSTRFTGLRVLRWQDGFETREWTAHLGRFMDACRKDQPACVLVLRSQLQVLVQRADLSGNPAPSVDRAIALSALSDLCEASAFVRSGDTLLFGLCNGQAGIAGYAAVFWGTLGYDELSAAYYTIHDTKIRAALAWMDAERAEDPVARDQRSRLAAQLSSTRVTAASHYETTDQLSAATGAWLSVMTDAVSKKNFAQIVSVALRLERIAFRLGEVEQGDGWRRLGNALLEERRGLRASLGCGLHQPRALADLARAVATGTPMDGTPVMRRLMELDCGYTQPAIDHAIASLRFARHADAASVAAMAIDRCKRDGDCAASRIRHLEGLLVIARGGESELLRESERWLAESRIDRFNAVERQTVWVLADALASSERGRGAARQLYDALDDQIHFERTSLTGMDVSRLKDLARYDELARTRVKAGTQQGHVLGFDRIESLRSRSLLRRLRMKRWQQEFAAVRDDKARAALEARLAEVSAVRSSLSGWGQADVFAPLHAALRAQVEDAETLWQEQYLAELASSQADATRGSRRPRWLQGGSDLVHHELGRFRPTQFASLGADDAYLSWLRVPGGYVATLALPDPQRKHSTDSHRLASRFVAVSGPMAATLDLYRQLLQSGAGASRGLKAAAPVADSGGLVLQGRPVWRQSDGSFIAAARPPAGSARARSLSELADAMFELLLGSFTDDLERTRRLIISPDGELAYLPFETLSNRGIPILARVDIAYVQSLAVHEELTTRARSAKRDGPVLLSMADPDYNVTAAAPAATQALPRALAAAKWAALLGTGAESAELLRLFPKGRQWLGAQASRRQLNELHGRGELKQYRILHFATHGYVDDERSALVLSMADGPAQAYLQDTDVLELSLDSDLVILSACDTGIGRSVSGEGVMGLPYAFVLAGNSNTLMSLWPVDDKGTAAFMSAFMGKVQKGSDLLVALNQTKREFAGGKHGKAFADSRIWAAFVQYGVGLSIAP